MKTLPSLIVWGPNKEGLTTQTKFVEVVGSIEYMPKMRWWAIIWGEEVGRIGRHHFYTSRSTQFAWSRISFLYMGLGILNNMLTSVQQIRKTGRFRVLAGSNKKPDVLKKMWMNTILQLWTKFVGLQQRIIFDSVNLVARNCLTNIRRYEPLKFLSQIWRPSLISRISRSETFFKQREKQKSTRKVPPDCFKWLFEKLFRTALDFRICFDGN